MVVGLASGAWAPSGHELSEQGLCRCGAVCRIHERGGLSCRPMNPSTPPMTCVNALVAIAFAWAGEAERGKKHYYRVQGPTFLIEHDNSQNDGNHVHSVWRDFDGDFGRDVLREHLKTVAH